MIFTKFDDLAGRDYQVVFADPPWSYTGNPLKDQAAGKHYTCMCLADMLAQFPLRKIMAKTSVALIWATSPLLHDAIDFIRMNGLYYRGVARVWVKTSKAGKIIHGQGVRPSIIKPTTEYLLAASTKKSGRPLPLLTESMGQVVLAPRPSKADGATIHSAKPDVFRDDIVNLFGDVKRVELFARKSCDGWDSFGNEL